MNEAQRRAWLALDVGPQWRLRDAGTPASADLESGSVAAPETIVAFEACRGVDAAEGAFYAEVADASLVAGSTVAPLEHRRAAIAACDWPQLRDAVASCEACGLCRSRSNTVFGVGDERADWFVVGEAPGAEEDRRGEPFVGRAGQLLDAMLAAVGKSRGNGVFIANILKCRPPGNRDPSPDEAAHCEPFLQRQIELVSPKLILVVGRVPAQALLGTEASLASLRGRVHRYRSGEREIPLVVTYHPAYLLRTPLDKAKAWVDLQLALRSALDD